MVIENNIGILMSKNTPSYNENDTLCTCMQVKRFEVASIAKKSKNLKHIINCTGAGSVCTSCQPLLYEMMGNEIWINVKIDNIQEVSSCVNLYTFSSEVNLFSPMNAGQYILIQGYINGKWEIRRYTLVSSSFDSSCRKIMVQKEPYGLFSSWLADKSIVNKHIRISQPLGGITPCLNNIEPLVCIVGGIGLTPAIAFIESIISSNSGGSLHMIHSISNEEKYIYKEQLEAYEKENSQISIEFHLVSKKGRINEKYIAKLSHKYKKSEFYICGLESFDKEISNYLRKSGIADVAIYIGSFNMASFKQVEYSKLYRYLGLFLFLIFLIQDFFSLKITALENLQSQDNFRIYSGLFVLIFIVMQFVRPYNKASERPHLDTQTYKGHKLRGVFAPLVFFIHSSSFGFGYLFFLSFLYFSNFLLGILNHEQFKDAEKRVKYYKKWLPLHIFLSVLSVAMMVIHIYIVGAY
jgi:ferredoxin-NADP reductase